MANSCVYIPKKGADTFVKLKKMVGYEEAARIFNIIEDKEFQQDYKESLSFDAEGFPTFDSLLKNEYIQEEIGEGAIIKYNNNQFQPVEDTLHNYEDLLKQAENYNKEGSYVAIVDYTEDDKLKINLYPKTEANVKKSNMQRATFKLNQKVVKVLENTGISLQALSEAEERAGRRGLTQFQAAKLMVGDAITLIKIANNAEGYEALSEEFAHLLVDNFADKPLIQRALKSLSNNEDFLKEVLGDEFEDVSNFYDGDLELVAEEALGKILQEGLLNNMADVPKSHRTLFQRIADYIKRFFKNIDSSTLYNTVSDIQLEMDNVAKQFLDGTIHLDKKAINKRNRDITFNSLSERVEKNIQVLKEAIKTETKRGVITKADSTIVTAKIAKIEQFANSNADTALGIMTYAQEGLKSLKNAYAKFDSLSLLPLNERFQTLLTLKTIMQSYGSFIHSLREIQSEEREDVDKLFDRTFNVGGEEIELDDVLKDLSDLVDKIGTEYNRVQLPLYAQFIREQLGDEVVKFIEDNHQKALEELFASEMEDIGLHDLWLNSMGDTNNVIVQIFDKLIKGSQDRARNRAYKLIQELEATRVWAESKGVTSYDWMFEKDKKGNLTGNYVDIDRDDKGNLIGVNTGEFDRQYNELVKSLEEDTNLSGQEKAKKKREWLEKYGWWDERGKIHPKPEYFPAARLTSTQEEVYKKILDIKERMDALYPMSKTGRYKAVQIRKDSLQRLMNSTHSVQDFISNYKEALKASFGVSNDDNTLYGDVGGLVNFDGTEFMQLPVLFTNKLKNPNELSTDVIGSLMSYAVATTKYDELSKIVAPMEVGRDLVNTQLKSKVVKTAGSKKFVETINKYGQSISSKIHMSTEPNLIRKLNDLLETQLYQRYLKDEGTTNVFGMDVNNSKFGRAVLAMNSTAQLAFNWLANTANVTQGLSMQNIELAAGQFFGAKEMASADAEFGKEITKTMLEANARNKTNFLDLFDDFMNVKQNYGNDRKDERANWVLRLFGNNIKFLGQEAGDFWLYNRAAIAYCKRLKVKYKGNTMSFYDLLKNHCKQEIEIEGKKTGVYELVIPEGVTTENGEVVDQNFANKHSRAIAHINQQCFGIYNQDDKTLAERTVFGLAATQYRKWLKPALNNRFKSRRTNLDTLTMEEGYYRTFTRFIRDVGTELKRGEIHIASIYSKLKPEEKANIRKVLMEVGQFLALIAFLRLAPFPDDDDDKLDESLRSRAITMSEYAAVRLKQELGALVPGTTMTNDMLKTVKSPMAVLGTLSGMSNLIGSLIDPDDWNNEIQSGKYKGHSNLYRNLMKSPFAPFAYKRQFERVSTHMDAAIKYYKSPAMY